MNIKWIVELITHLLTSGTIASKNSSKKVPSPLSQTVEPVIELTSLVEKDGYYIWQKDQEYPLSAHFGTREFNCRCDHETCKEQRVSKSLIEKLELIREEVGQPLIVTSAFRCSAHQADIRSSGISTVVAKKSTHELGDAADIVPKDRKDVQGSFLKICAQHFDSIGLSDRFLHVDLRSGIRRWNY